MIIRNIIDMKNIIRKILNILFPKICVLCKNNINTNNKEYLCVACENKLIKNHKINDNSLPEWIFYRYNYKDDKVKKIEYIIKYNHNKYLCHNIGAYCRKYIEAFILSDNETYIFVPVPLHINRYKNRGYNQAEEIAKGINLCPIYNILKREKSTSKLFNKKLQERTAEIENAFSINEKEINRLKEKYNINQVNIILIDDIITTGNTIFQARKTLLNYGFDVNNIQAFCIAH